MYKLYLNLGYEYIRSSSDNNVEPKVYVFVYSACLSNTYFIKIKIVAEKPSVAEPFWIYLKSFSSISQNVLTDFFHPYDTGITSKDITFDIVYFDTADFYNHVACLTLCLLCLLILVLITPMLIKVLIHSLHDNPWKIKFGCIM